MNTKKPLLAALFVLACASTTAALGQTREPLLPATGIALQTPFGTSDILAWSWGASNSGTTVFGGGGGAGKASFQDVSLTRFTDKQSAALLGALAKGTILPKVTIRKGTMRLTLMNVLVTAISTGGSFQETAFTENVTFNFSEFNYSPDGVTVTCWNIAESAPSSSCTPSGP
jgi:type VI secretion system secreted protein Hcp